MNIIINTESRRVTLDGTDYEPKQSGFGLTDWHFEAAAKLSNAFELIRYAHDNEQSVEGMLAWGRAIDAVVPLPEKPTPKAAKKKPEPLVFGGKPKEQLF